MLLGLFQVNSFSQSVSLDDEFSLVYLDDEFSSPTILHHQDSPYFVKTFTFSIGFLSWVTE